MQWSHLGWQCWSVEDGESGRQQGWKGKCWCLPSLPSPPSLGQDSAQSSVQAWLRKEMGGIQASGWFHVQNGDAAGLREHLPPAVAPPAGCWYGTLCWQLVGWLEEGGQQADAGILRCHKLFTASCHLADPSAFLLLSVPILCFLTLLPLKQTVHVFWLPLVLRDFRVN